MTAMRAVLRLVLPVAIATLALVPSAALAHSNSVDSDPADDARIPTLPRVATVTFNEPVADAAFALTRPDGRTVKIRAGIDGVVVKAALPKDGVKGDYVLAYRVVSEDGHPVTGEVEFTVTTGVVAPATGEAIPGEVKTATAESWALGLPPFWGIAGGAAVLLVAAILLVRAARR
jgi:methionine-rich copper-binding protein CopC